MRRIALMFAVLGVLIFWAGIINILAENIGSDELDLVAYYDGAERLRAGLPLYREQVDLRRENIQYVYPPLTALVFLVFPTYPAAWWGWAAFSAACMLATVWLLLRELGPLLRRRVDPVWWLILIIALLNYPPVVSHLLWGQVQLQIALLLTGAWLCLRRGREYTAGALIGVAIAVKLYPLLLFAPLLAARRWRAVALALATALGITALSFLLAGPGAFTQYFTQVLPEINQTLGNNNPKGYSLTTMLKYLLGDSGVVVGLSLALRALILGAVTLAAARMKDAPDRALALGVTTLVLVTPTVWTHYFVLLYLPWLELLARAPRRRQYLLALAYLLIAVSSMQTETPGALDAILRLFPIGGGLLLLGAQLHDATFAPAESEPQPAGANATRPGASLPVAQSSSKDILEV